MNKMGDMPTDFGRRLKQARKHAKLNQQELCALVGISQPNLSKLEQNGFSSSFTAQIAHACGVDPVWLATGDGEMLATKGIPQNVHNDSLRLAVTGRVPLLNRVSAGMFREIMESGEEPELIATTAPTKTYTFALKVDGDSMEPEFQHGDLVIVEPEMDPIHQDFVVVVNGDNEATLKQFIKDGSDLLLKPLNPRYQIKPLRDARIIGVVIAKQKQYRT